MAKYIHYNKDTLRFVGFFDSSITAKIPEPNVEITDSQHRTFYENIINQKSVKIGSLQILPHEAIVLETTWADVRVKRNALLADSDWTQLPDVPADLKAKWAVYRQALRDITTMYQNIDDIIWPTKPA